MPFLSALPPPALVAACATPPHGKVQVVAGIDAWDIRPTVDMAALGRMAKASGLGGAHPAYGFYSSSVAYAVRTDIGNAARDVCQGPLNIHVMMRLTNRHIGITKDVPAGSCRFARITAHYRHHAEADEATFQQSCRVSGPAILPAASKAGSPTLSNCSAGMQRAHHKDKRLPHRETRGQTLLPGPLLLSALSVSGCLSIAP